MRAVFFNKSVYLLIGVWALSLWLVGRPESIAADWQGWRQADTQAIAINFRDSGNSFLYPQIDWRGKGEGYVETEFQLYTLLVSALLPDHSRVEWPGQLVSLVTMVATVFLMFWYLRREFSEVPAAFAVAFLLGHLGVLHLATSVQPDGLCFFFYCAALISFHRFLRTERLIWLVASTVASILASLVKPPALHLGIIQFCAVVLMARHLLWRPALWLAWGAILGALALYVWHAHSLYVAYGNSFGIGFGGDSKWPSVHELLDPSNYYRLLRVSMTWGVGALALLGAIYLGARKRLNQWELSLFIGNFALLIVSMRYSQTIWLGSHYHIFTAFLGAWLLAHAISEFARHERESWQRGLYIVLPVALLLMAGVHLQQRVNHPGRTVGESIVSFARLSQPFVRENDAIVVRAPATKLIDGWAGGKNNYEDPRLFYLTTAKGWVLAADDDCPQCLAKMAGDGAILFMDLNESSPMTPKTQSWLKQHAQILVADGYGTLYRLAPTGS